MNKNIMVSLQSNQSIEDIELLQRAEDEEITDGLLLQSDQSSGLISDISNWRYNLSKIRFEFLSSNSSGIITDISRIQASKKNHQIINLLFEASGNAVKRKEISDALKLLGANALNLRISYIRKFFKENSVPLSIPKVHEGSYKLIVLDRHQTPMDDQESQRIISIMWYQAVQNVEAYGIFTQTHENYEECSNVKHLSIA